MRVAQVITLFLPEFIGGATLACARIAHGLQSRGHDVAIFTGRPGAEASPAGVRTYDVDGLPVTAVDAASGYVALDTRGYRHDAITAHFAAFLDRVRPDVVHLHSLQALGVTVVDAAHDRGIPVVVTMHDWWWFCVRLFLVDPAGFVCGPRVDSARCHCAPELDLVARRRELTRALGRVARVLTPSRFLAESAIANGVDRARVEVCPNGIDLPPATVRRRPGPVRFGYFGGPDNRLKGLPTLLAAAAALRVGGWTLRLFGVPRGEARVPLALVDRIATAPSFAPAALADMLATLDCLVVPSLMRESYSLVTREALAAGVPVIASDSGGPQEVLDPAVNGLTFATGDAADLAACMRRLVLQPAVRERLAEGAAGTSIPTVAAQVEQLERVYRDVAAPAEQTERFHSEVAPPAEQAARPHREVAAAPAPLRRVLFVSGIDGAPFRYRVTHLREQLRLRGVASDACYYTDPSLVAAIAAADLVIVYRVPMSGWVTAWMAHARALGVPLVFACDDLVFDPSAVPEDALALLPEPQRAGWRAYVARYRETLRACDAFLGSTEPLVAAAGRAGVAGAVVRNGLGAAELTVAEESRRMRARHDGELRIAYLSGTIMHDLDFALVEPSLAALLAEMPSVRLVLVGYLRTGPALAPFADRIERLPFLPWPRLFALLAGVDVSLAPLRDDPFSVAKSEVKYLEAGGVGVPTIASAAPAFRAAIRHGTNGLLAATRADWDAALRALAGDAGLRRRLGNAARDDVALRAGPEAQADALIAALEELRRTAPVRPSSAAGATAANADAFAGEVGRYDLEPGDALPDTGVPARDGSSPVLTPGRSVGQIFRAETDGLCRVDVAVGTDGAARAPAVVVRVAAGPDTRDAVLRRVDVAAGAIADDAWIAAEFTPIPDSAGRTFYIWVETSATDATVTDATGPDAAAVGAETTVADDSAAPITLRTYTAGWGEAPPAGLHLDHRPVAGSLAFRTFCRPPRVTRPGASPSPSPSPP